MDFRSWTGRKEGRGKGVTVMEIHRWSADDVVVFTKSPPVSPLLQIT